MCGDTSLFFADDVFCKHTKCQKQIPYVNWSHHCKKDHADRVPHTGDVNDGNDSAVQPGQCAPGVGEVVSKEPESKKRYVQRKNLGTQKGQVANANDSSSGKTTPEKNPK